MPRAIDDGVDRTEGARIVAQTVQKGDHGLLVGHGDVRTEHFICTQRGDGGREMLR